MYRIRRFGIVKTATVVAVIYMVVTAIFIVPFALIASVAAPSDSAFPAAGSIIVLGLLGIVFYGVIGWIFTAIGCAIYNLVGRWTGGIEVQIEPVAPTSGDTPWTPTAPTAPPVPPAAPAG